MAISLDQAEAIAKKKLREYFNREKQNVTRELASRMGVSAERSGDNWIVNIDIYAGGIRPIDPSSKSLLDDSPETRAKTWMRVFVDSQSGDAEITEECKLSSLL